MLEGLSAYAQRPQPVQPLPMLTGLFFVLGMSAPPKSPSIAPPTQHRFGPPKHTPMLPFIAGNNYQGAWCVTPLPGTSCYGGFGGAECLLAGSEFGLTPWVWGGCGKLVHCLVARACTLHQKPAARLAYWRDWAAPGSSTGQNM